MTFVLLMFQKKEMPLGLTDLEWRYLKDGRAGEVTLKDPWGEESLE